MIDTGHRDIGSNHRLEGRSFTARHIHNLGMRTRSNRNDFAVLCIESILNRRILSNAIRLLDYGDRSELRHHVRISIDRIYHFAHIGTGFLEDADSSGTVTIVDIVMREVYLGTIGEVIALKFTLYGRAGHLVAGYGRRKVNIRSTLNMDKALGSDGIRIGGRFFEGVPDDRQLGTGNRRELNGIPVAVREGAIGHRCGSSAVNRGKLARRIVDVLEVDLSHGRTVTQYQR